MRQWKGSGLAPERFRHCGCICGRARRIGTTAPTNRKQWNRLAKEIETEACDIAREESGAQVKRYVARARIPKRGGVLVDLGCGVGTFIAQYLGIASRTVIGVGIRRRHHRTRETALRGDGQRHLAQLGIARAASRIGRRADLTVCMNVITSSDAATRAALWKSLAAVTKKGGHALVVVPSIESDDMVEEEENGRKRRKTAARMKGLVWRSDAWQKHFAREELTADLARVGFHAKTVGKAHYPWSIEGMRETAARRANRPWDWIVLAERV